jgi:hypothetical protein
MALELPLLETDMNASSWTETRQGPSGLHTPSRILQPRSSGLTLWQPDIVLAGIEKAPRARPTVLLGEPALRPEAVQAQMAATRSALESLAEARSLLRAEAAAGQARTDASGTERQRVTAIMETYRIKRALDAALRATLREVSTLMEERGIR